MGMVGIALARGFAYDVRELAEFAYRQLGGHSHLVGEADVVPQAVEFVLERVARVLSDEGLARDVVDAVLPSAVFLDLAARARGPAGRAGRLLVGRIW